MAGFKKVQGSWADKAAVIVGIVLCAVVAVCLFPPIQQNRGSRLELCPSNEKQIGLGFLQYAQDYDETWPTGNSTSGIGWAGSLYFYVKSPGVFKCPLDPTVASGSNFPVSYAYNTNLANEGNRKAVTCSEFDEPHDTVVLSEVNGDVASIESEPELNPDQVGQESPATNGVSGVWDTYSKGESSVSGITNAATGPISGTTLGGIPVHDGGANYLLADGHVRWLTPNHVSGGFNARTDTTCDEAFHADGTSTLSSDDASGQSSALATFSVN